MAKILIIDDEEQLRRLMARIIGLEGYEVAEAPDCASGMKTLRRYDPDVVLCDVKLPDGNGVEMVGRIKEAAPATEVILLTAYGNIPDGVQAIKNGAFDFLPKPLDDEKLLASVEKAIALDWERRSHHTSHTAAMKDLATLTPREEHVIKLRFGLYDGRCRTLEVVGKEFDITRERIRQIEAKALRKLRHPSRARHLRGFID